MNLTEFELESKELIRNNENEKFIEIWTQNWSNFKRVDFTSVYICACQEGNVAIVDYLLNHKPGLAIDFNYFFIESMGYGGVCSVISSNATSGR